MERQLLLGAHLSIAGGYYRAVERAAELGCDTVQLFTRSNVQWRAKPLTKADCTRFQQALQRTGIRLPSAHANYLINLASADRAKREQSIRVLASELRRCKRLGIPYLVLHPGAHQGQGEARGLKKVVGGILRAFRDVGPCGVRLLLETTAGQGSNLGYRFEHLEAILNDCGEPQRLGVCIDTCHLFAAGYPLAPKSAYEETMEKLDRLIGLDQVRVIHLNDSQKPFGSRVDRHAHIGRGAMGKEPFRLLLNDPRWRGVPMYLETPKGVENGQDMDAVNLLVLRSLISAPGRRRG